MSWKYNPAETSILKTDRIVLPAAATNATATQANISGFSVGIAAYERLGFVADLVVTGGTNGAVFRFTGPTTIVEFRQTYLGNSTGITAMTAGTTTSYSAGAGTATGALINNATPFTGVVRLFGYILNSSTAGTLQLQFATASGTDSMSVLAGSVLQIIRNS